MGRDVNQRLRGDGGLAVALAFAAGAMVVVTFGEIVPKSVDGFASDLGVVSAWTVRASLIAAGVALVGGLTWVLDAWATEQPRSQSSSEGDLLPRQVRRRQVTGDAPCPGLPRQVSWSRRAHSSVCCS